MGLGFLICGGFGVVLNQMLVNEVAGLIRNVFMTASGSQPSILLFLQQDSTFFSIQGKVNYEWQESMS